jgi:protein translocase SecG subunit
MEILHLALTIILFLISLFLILLVLVQLPKKEAGLGTAFGGGTTDALFGAGTGNVLTQLTKYCTILFLVLCLVLAWMGMHDKETNTAGTDKGKAKKEQPAQPGNELGGTPSGTTTKPSGTTTEPSGTTTEPSGTTTEPSGTTTEPSGTTTEPSDSTTKPSDSTTKPSDSTPEPTPTEGEPNKK